MSLSVCLCIPVSIWATYFKVWRGKISNVNVKFGIRKISRLSKHKLSEANQQFVDDGSKNENFQYSKNNIPPRNIPSFRMEQLDIGSFSLDWDWSLGSTCLHISRLYVKILLGSQLNNIGVKSVFVLGLIKVKMGFRLGYN